MTFKNLMGINLLGSFSKTMTKESRFQKSMRCVFIILLSESFPKSFFSSDQLDPLLQNISANFPKLFRIWG